MSYGVKSKKIRIRPTRGDGPEGARASSRPSIPIPLPSSAHSPHRDTAHNAVLDRRHAALPLARGARGSRRAARAVGPCPPFLPRARSPRTRIPPPRSQRDRKLRRKPHLGTQTQTQCSALSVRPPRHPHRPPARRRARSLAAGVVFFFVFFVFFPWLARSLSHPRKLFISNTTVHAVHFGPLCAGLSPVAVAAVHRRPARRRPPLFPTGETVDAYRRRRLPRLLLHVLAPKGPSDEKVPKGPRRAGSFGLGMEARYGRRLLAHRQRQGQ